MSGIAGQSGPPGNTNSSDGRRYRKALERALAHQYGSVDDGLLAVAAKRVEKAGEGDQAACEHIADRIDGKVPQGHQGVEDGPPIQSAVRILFGKE